MPQMGPILWVVFPYLIIFFITMCVLYLSKEGDVGESSVSVMLEEKSEKEW